MDWTFWVGGAVIIVLWVVTQWAFSNRRRSEKARGRNAEAADAMIDVDRGKAQGDAWRDL
ncbi:hypothetical protein [Agromyces sp. Marseille-Q5079]|uniref:hypothetical protein n=1 Tax=Agromyces sp. Marseille-Q5079 TaxID=3439059 RepID=UPI003D9CB5DF